MKKAAMWASPEGLIYPAADITYHHVFAQSTAHSKKQRDFIGLYGLVPPMLDEWHNHTDKSLHANVPFPPMPTPDLINRVTEFANNYTERRVYDRFIGIAEYLGDLSTRSGNTDIRKQAGCIAENLSLQAPFILEGMVHPIKEDRRQ